MEKKFIFVATGQKTVEAAPGEEEPGMEIKQFVICSEDDATARTFLNHVEPALQIVSIVPLTMYEETLKKVRAVLIGEDTSWPIYVDPALSNAD